MTGDAGDAGPRGNPVAGFLAAGAAADRECIAEARVEGGVCGFQRPAGRQRKSQREFGPVASGGGDVAEAAATTDIACHRQFIAGIGPEHRRFQPRARGIAPPATQLEVAAQRGSQFQRKPGAAIGTVAELVEGGRLEAATARQVQAEIGRRRVHQAHHRCRPPVVHGAAVVRIAGGDVVVARCKPDRAVARAHQQRPRGRPLPPGLRVLVEGPHPVVLIATQDAAHAEPIAIEVLVAAPVLPLLLVGDAGV